MDYSGGSFGGRTEEEAEETYKFYIEMILHFQKLFDYKGSIQDILSLPYNLFQDLIIARVREKREEKNFENDIVTKLGLGSARQIRR